MKKVLYTVCRNYFSIKSYSTLSAKMFKMMDHYPRFHHSEMHTIYGILYTLYGIHCRFYTLYYIHFQKTRVKTAKNGEMR